MNTNAIWVKRQIAGVDQSYLFNINSLTTRSYLAVPDPSQITDKNFLTGIAGVLVYSVDSYINSTFKIMGSNDAAFNATDFAVIKEGTNNAQESDYIEVIKLSPGDVIGITSTAIEGTFSANAPAKITDDGKWAPAESDETAIAYYLGTDANGLYIFHIEEPFNP